MDVSKELHQLHQAVEQAKKQVGSKEVGRILEKLFSFSKTHHSGGIEMTKITFQQLMQIKASDLEKVEFQQLLKFAGAVNRLMIETESKKERNSIGIVMGMILRELELREKQQQAKKEA